MIGGEITDDHQLRSPLRFEISAVLQHLFQGDRRQQRPPLFTLEVRYLRNHLNRHDRLIVGFAFIRRIHHLGVPGFGLLQLFFGWRIAEVAVEQGVKQLRQMLGIAVGVNHQAVIRAGREADAADRRLVAELVERDTRQVIIERKYHLAAGAVHRLRVAQHQRDIRFRFAGEILARRVNHPQRRFINDQLRMRVSLVAFD